MKKTFTSIFCSVLFTFCTAILAGPIPEISDLEQATLFPKNGILTVAPEGHFLVNGIPRYLPGTIFYEGVISTIRMKTDGYSEDLAWLYEAPHDYNAHQRVGFDATGICTSTAWIEKYRPGKPRSFASLGEDDMKIVIGSGLPLYVDFTGAHWNHGQLKYVEGEAPCKDAFTQPSSNYHHWMFYNPNHAEGMQLYEDMWRHGVEKTLALGGRPFVYELFNEPDFNDLSPATRAAFVQSLKERYSSIDALNKSWHTDYPDFETIGAFNKEVENPAQAIEWIKFMEESFLKAVRRGAEVIHKADPRPEVLVCVQPLKGKLSNVNQYEVNQLLNAVCTCTGGGNSINAREYLSMAEGGRPVFDGETYLGNKALQIRTSLITQFARGLNASFAFKWDRRPWDAIWKKEKGGQKLADLYPWMLLNPYYVAAEELNAIRQTKEELLQISHLFAPRNRGIQPKIALLFSQPARRLSRATGIASYNLYYDYAMALERSALPYDIIYEGQMAERSARYAVIFVPGVACLEDSARTELERYARNGGTVVFIQEALQLNEYGFEYDFPVFPGIRPGKEIIAPPAVFRLINLELKGAAARQPEFAESESWATLAEINDVPVVWKRALGDGCLIYSTLQMPEEAMGAFVQWIANEKTVPAICSLTDELTGHASLDIETYMARSGSETGYIFINQALGIRCIRIKPSVSCDCWCIPRTHTRILPDEDGTLVLQLERSNPVILVGGSKDDISKYAITTEISSADCRKAALEAIEDEKRMQRGEDKAFHIAPEHLKMLDIRDWANSRYLDSVAGDGKGGWTDQGENCLRNVPYDVTDCNGIPIDFIRPDMNHDRSCIVLGSNHLPNGDREVTGITVKSPASRIFFLHGHAWGEGNSEIFRYVIHYSDGSSVSVPIRCGIESADWYWMNATLNSKILVPGWANKDGRGLWLFAWTNPHPDKEIATIDAVSSWNAPIGLIGGITLELPREPDIEFQLNPAHPQNWGGLKAHSLNEDGKEPCTFIVTPKCSDWCGSVIPFMETTPIPENLNGFLSFEINGGNDEWGKHQGGQLAQSGFRLIDENGKAVKSANRPWNLRVDDNPESWQEVRIRLDVLFPQKHDNLRISGFFIQFYRMSDYKAGVSIRNVKITYYLNP